MPCSFVSYYELNTEVSLQDPNLEFFFLHKYPEVE